MLCKFIIYIYCHQILFTSFRNVICSISFRYGLSSAAVESLATTSHTRTSNNRLSGDRNRFCSIGSYSPDYFQQRTPRHGNEYKSRKEKRNIRLCFENFVSHIIELFLLTTSDRGGRGSLWWCVFKLLSLQSELDECKSSSSCLHVLQTWKFLSKSSTLCEESKWCPTARTSRIRLRQSRRLWPSSF